MWFKNEHNIYVIKVWNVIYRYKRKRLDMLNEEDERQVRKYAKISEKMRNAENKYLGISEMNSPWILISFK